MQAHFDARAVASQLHRLVQELGHLLVVGVILALRPALDIPVVLQLGRSLLRETLRDVRTESARASSIG